MTGKTLAFMQWPAADRAAWERLFVDEGLFGATGRGCGWSPATVGKLRYSHGRWLAHLATEHSEALAWPQHERLSRELVGAWLTALALRGLKPSTITSFLDGLVQLHAAFNPDLTPRWLRRHVRALMADAYAKSDRPDYRIKIDVIWHDFLAALRILEASADRTIRSAITYRDRLMLAVLTFTLLRRKNLAQLQLDRDLTWTEEGWNLKVDAHTVKNHREIVRLLPTALGRYLDVYLQRVRPKLLRGKQSDDLWINNVGGPLLPDDLAKAVKRTTRRMFGITLTPHDLRRIAPTTIATDAPEQIYLASQLLGHASRRTTEQHYNRASSLSAGRRHADVIEGLRTGAERRVERGSLDRPKPK